MKIMFIDRNYLKTFLYYVDEIEDEYNFRYLNQINKSPNKIKTKSIVPCCSHLMKPHPTISLLYCEKGCGRKINL